MPKLWNATVAEHRREVRDAILDTAARLVVDQGLLSVTMSQIAEETSIGRATLYKYFSDVEAILRAWHERQIDRHLTQLAQASDRSEDPGERLEAVLMEYAFIAHESHGHNDAELATLLHRDEHVTHAEQQLCEMIRGLLTEAQKAGDVRRDVGAEELTNYCLHALTAAGRLRSKAAVGRLVEVVLAGVRP